MRNYRTDTMWGAPCSGYHIQYRFSEAGLSRISVIQDFIEERIPGLRRVPENGIHMTTLTLIPAQAGYVGDADWLACRESCIGALTSLCVATKPFSVTLNTVRALDSAIVLMTEYCEPLQTFRRKLVDCLASLDQRLIPPSIAHASLFRYEDINTDNIRALNDLLLFVDICCPVSELLLVRELRFPSLEIEILDRFHLTG